MSKDRQRQRRALVSLIQRPSISQLADLFRTRLLQRLANARDGFEFELEDSSTHRPSTLARELSPLARDLVSGCGLEFGRLNVEVVQNSEPSHPSPRMRNRFTIVLAK